MTPKDYSDACTIAEKILHRFEEMYGNTQGMFSFQFFKSRDQKIFFNEIDVRPGDPEIVVILENLKSKFSILLESMFSMDSKSDIEFSSECVIVKCLVPRSYPGRSRRVQDFRINTSLAGKIWVNIHWGNCSKLANNHYRTGLSRTVAMSKSAKTFAQCIDAIDTVAKSTNGVLQYRTDIGIF